MNLPTFKYHPDPIASGSVEPSETECVCCGKARGYVYTANAYGAAKAHGPGREEACVEDLVHEVRREMRARRAEAR